jgi:YidC/Oxa1 family membrane protein insertase
MKKIREKYKDDRQRQSEELMKLNKEAGVNPLAGCLPALIQAPVFLGLFHVLRSFKPGWGQVYFFGRDDVQSFVDAKLFGGPDGGGAPLSSFITMPRADLDLLGGTHSTVVAVAIPLMILAGIATHLTSRRSISRQSAEAANAPQTRIMNKVMLYLFPFGVVAGGPFFPLAILIYWLSNNTWTFFQLFVAHRIQDRQKAEVVKVVEEEKAAQAYTKPRPGARPQDPKRPVVKPSPVQPPSVQPLPVEPAEDGGVDKPPTISTNGGSTPLFSNGSNGSSPRPGARPTPGARPAGSRPGGAGQNKKRKR